MAMKKAEYDKFVQDLYEIFNSLFQRDVLFMTPEERRQHQKLLSAAHIAWLAAENQQLATLNAEAAAHAPELAKAAKATRQQLAGLQSVSQVLDIVDEALDLLTSVAKLFV